MAVRVPTISPAHSDNDLLLLAGCLEDQDGLGGDSLGRASSAPKKSPLRGLWKPAALALSALAALAAVAAAPSVLRAVAGPPLVGSPAGGALRLNAEAAAPAGKPVSLFCFSVMKAHSNEQTLLEFALKKRTSIFKCNAFAVISSKKINLGPGDDGDVITWFNPTPSVQIGQLGANGVTTNSFLNTEIFQIAWDTLVKSKQLDGHDFVVKADPDAVFLPDRLDSHVRPHTGQPVYFPNCNLFQDSPPAGPKLYGALEIFSKQAIDLYGNGGSQRCHDQMNWHGWGEDYYMQSCMMLLGVQAVPDFTLVGDHRCIPAPCSDGLRVAFHDFKDIESYNKCFETAIGL